ncbi:hypothetical protein EIP86_006676 [Pleurotus ostreatoroseus]|nr:hypothetical protein EIP86_006676 [Pleurotus ostreatoroseus]
MLQAQGIILTPEGNNRKRPAGPNDAGPSKRARAGSATPQEEDEEDDVKPEVAEEQLQALLAERAALEARIRAAEARRVKREPSPIVIGAASGEVIDLTDD